MNFLKLLVWLASIISLCSAASIRQRRQTELRPFTLEETVPSTFGQSGFNGSWTSDTQFSYTISSSPGIYLYDASTLSQSVLVSEDVLELLNTTTPVVSPDQQYILARSDVTSVFRYSIKARYSLYNIATGEITYIANHELLELCIFDRSTHALAYVQNNNVYYLPVGSTEAIQLTFDGIPDVIYNGHADWVYEEEILGTGTASWFSTDGSRLAIASFDDTEIETYSFYYYTNLQDPDSLYTDLYNLKYPKVGRKNPPVLLRYVTIADVIANPSNVVWNTLSAPDVVTSDHVLGGVSWPSSNEIAVHWLNRRQNLGVLRICNAETNVCTDDVREELDGWVPSALPVFSSNADFYINRRWTDVQSDGERWLGLMATYRQADGNITSYFAIEGAFVVDNFLGMRETQSEPVLYYTRTVEGAPWRRHVYANQQCLSCNIVMPQGGECTWASATVSRGGSYMAITCQSTFEPALAVLYDPINNNILMTWEANLNLRERLEEYILPERLTTTVTLVNGVEAPVTFYLPPGIDFEDTTKSYPLIVYVYSGPNYYLVQDTFSLGYNAYLTTNRSVVYMMMDVRGSAYLGRSSLFAINNGLGSVEIEDNVYVIRVVLNRYSWLDNERVGMWGSSYGGYSTLLSMIHDDEDIIKCGISSAPVSSFIYYDTLYTERYMGLPTQDDNLAGYQYGDITAKAEQLRGKNFFIMHGTADDNVHFQNAAHLLKRLQELNIPFKQMSYTDEAHSLSGVTRHRYNTMERFWNECLRLDEREFL